MDEVQIDIEDSWGIGLLGDNMRIPDFLKESLWHRKHLVIARSPSGDEAIFYEAGDCFVATRLAMTDQLSTVSSSCSSAEENVLVSQPEGMVWGSGNELRANSAAS